jgi:hypothetical protein
MRNTLFTLICLLCLIGCSTNNNGVTTVVPAAPTNLTGTAISGTQINLSWTDNATNETGYKIQRKISVGNYTDIGSTGTDVTSFSDLGLTNNTAYTYRVYAYNAAGNSLQYSNEITITTGSGAGSNVYMIWHDYNPTTGDSLKGYLWKNGLSTILPDSFVANDGIVSGTDVLLAGERSIRYPAISKNGILTYLNLMNNTGGEAYSLCVSGNNIYTAGHVYNSVAGTGNRPATWKNGVLTMLNINTGWNGFAFSVYASGSDVYVAGNIGTSISTSNTAAVLWKNGTLNVLANSGTASSVFVSGSDVYVAGSSNGFPILWKNGVATQLGVSNGSAKKVFVSGSDVYVTGTSNGYPTYWKNGLVNQVSSSIIGIANTVLFSGSDIYVGGYGIYQNTQVLTPIFWKNGIPTQLSNSEGEVSNFFKAE